MVVPPYYERDQGVNAESEDKSSILPNRDLVPEWDFPLREYANLKTLTLVVARDGVSASKLSRFFRRGWGIASICYGVQPSGVRELSERATEFHELGRIANEYQCTTGFTTRGSSPSGLETT
jgi:hypothetical protein